MHLKLLFVAMAVLYLSAPVRSGSIPTLRKLLDELKRLQGHAEVDSDHSDHAARHPDDDDDDDDADDKVDATQHGVDGDEQGNGDELSDERVISTRGNSVSDAFIFEDQLYIHFLEVAGFSPEQFAVDVYDTDMQRRVAHVEDLPMQTYAHQIKNVPSGSNYVINACRQGDFASNCDIFVCPSKLQNRIQQCVRKVKFCTPSRASLIPDKPGSWVCNQISQNSLVRLLASRFLN